jgi:hypothetical protein
VDDPREERERGIAQLVLLDDRLEAAVASLVTELRSADVERDRSTLGPCSTSSGGT